MSDCDDPECPGCIMKRAVNEVFQQGLDVDDIIPLFFMSLAETFKNLGLNINDGEITLYDKGEDTLH